MKEKYIEVKTAEDLFFYTLYNVKAYWIIGIINTIIAKKIERTIGYNVKGFKYCIYDHQLKHFYYRHYDEKLSNQRNLCFKDIQRLKDVFVNCCKIEKGNVTNRIKIRKNFKDGILEFVAEINLKNKTITGKSLRVKKPPCPMY